jgi:hypothetical protein
MDDSMAVEDLSTPLDGPMAVEGSPTPLMAVEDSSTSLDG